MGCITFKEVEVSEPIQWKFKIYEVDGEKLICEEPEKLYKALKANKCE